MMARAEDRIAKALEVMKEADLKLHKLRSLHPFLIDVSLRETSVGHHIGQTLKEKLEILPKIREFGLQNIVLGALNYSIPDELSVDDDFMLHLRDHGHDLKGCFAFTSLGIQSADGNFQPDPSQIKIKSYRIPHTIHEIFLCSENRKALYDRETLLRSLPASITLSISASILSRMQMEKMMMRCCKVCVAAKAVALMSQNRITLGLSVFIRKPEVAVFT